MGEILLPRDLARERAELADALAAGVLGEAVLASERWRWPLRELVRLYVEGERILAAREREAARIDRVNRAAARGRIPYHPGAVSGTRRVRGRKR